MDFRRDPRRPAPDRGPPPPRRMVRCPACGRTEEVSALDLPGYVQSGWPRCCGGVMNYSLEPDPGESAPG